MDVLTLTDGGGSWAACDSLGTHTHPFHILTLINPKIRKGLKAHMAEARGGGTPKRVDLDLERESTGERFRLFGVRYEGRTQGEMRLSYQSFARLDEDQ